jgi:putative DNA primase/helicase
MERRNGPGALAGAAEAGDLWAWIVARPNTASTGPVQLASDAGTLLDAALGCARRGLAVFPCHWAGERRKGPVIERGLLAATRDETQIRDWWRRWPNALIGIPTGCGTGFVVLDVDIKGAVNGFDTLAELGFGILPDTPMVHTASGGLHLYFRAPDNPEIRNTAGAKGRGIGHGLDWRGRGGYVIVPSPGSGYHWDPHWNLDTVPLQSVPDALLPREPGRSPTAAGPIQPAMGLSPYAEAALELACRRILTAAHGEQEQTLNAECFAIGTLAGSGAIPSEFALRVLLWAARQIPDYDHRHPWRAAEIQRKVKRAFEDGMRHPRERRRV